VKVSQWTSIFQTSN